MPLTRRDVLHSALAASSVALLPDFLRTARPREPLKILILGGTGFLGPALVEVAKAKGHTLTLFNRGKTRPNLFPDIEKLQGDRDPKKGEGLKALEGKKWDVVFDDCGYYPRHVKASAELLAPNVKHYLYVSSISCYASLKEPNLDETAKLATMEDPTLETMGDQYQHYGALKALCEQAAETACPKKTTVIRPGYIVGPGDSTDRFTYWPWRFKRGGEMVVPGDGSDPVQIIDVRDLAAFMVHLAEKNIVGTYNTIGPEKTLTMKDVLMACATVLKTDTKVVWVPNDFLKKEGIELDGGFPIYAPGSGETAGNHRVSFARAQKDGLHFRTVTEIIQDLMAWFEKLPPERQAKFRSGMPADAEAKILDAWKAAKQTK